MTTALYVAECVSPCCGWGVRRSHANNEGVVTFGGLVGARDTGRLALLQCHISNLWAALVSPCNGATRMGGAGVFNTVVGLKPSR